MSQKQLVSKIGFARRAGADKSAVAKALHGNLAKALVFDKIDTEHPEAVAFIEKSQQGRGKRVKTDNHILHKKITDENCDTDINYSDRISELANLTLRDLIRNYGTDHQFHEWLKSLKMVEDIQTKQLSNATIKSELISRVLVKKAVIEPIEAAHIRLLTDGAKSISIRTKAMCAAGAEATDVQLYIATAIGKFIKPLKKRIKAQLKEVQL